MTVSMSRVGVAVRGVFSELEKHIKSDPGKLPASASVYGLTSYMVNYLNLLYAYNETLTKLYTTSNVVMPVPKLMRALQDDEDEEGEEYVEEFLNEEGEEEQDKFYGEPLPEYMEAGTLISRKLQVPLSPSLRALLLQATVRAAFQPLAQASERGAMLYPPCFSLHASLAPRLAPVHVCQTPCGFSACCA